MVLKWNLILLSLLLLFGFATAQGSNQSNTDPTDSTSTTPASGNSTDLSPTEWMAKLQELIELVNSTFGGMGDIAVADNPEVGAKIVMILSGELTKAAAISSAYSAAAYIPSPYSAASGMISGGYGILKKRAADSGNEAYNGVGDVLVKSNDKIAPEKKKLSPDAQKKIDKKHREGVEKCGADSCKAAAKLLAEADNAEGERQ